MITGYLRPSPHLGCYFSYGGGWFPRFDIPPEPSATAFINFQYAFGLSNNQWQWWKDNVDVWWQSTVGRFAFEPYLPWTCCDFCMNDVPSIAKYFGPPYSDMTDGPEDKKYNLMHLDKNDPYLEIYTSHPPPFKYCAQSNKMCFCGDNLNERRKDSRPGQYNIKIVFIELFCGWYSYIRTKDSFLRRGPF